MITFKCKMCGGDLRPEENATTCECEYCGSVQTVPTADSEKKMNLFGRAQRLLRVCEFDKAAGVYESIVAEFPEEAEAYWGLVLCKYGIEYVDDPATGKKVPTCHRTRSDSIMDDSDFEQACENADAIAKKVYREEAKAIDRLQRDILSVVANESPYDVFICYKETDENGERTEDSVLAQDIYDALTTKGLKVFFARITLEDKLGQQYEPYIYAALHSAKVMLSIGTEYEYFDAVWVKNEWARFLDMMKEDRTKTLIPCYKGIDAYDMPREFKNLQAQDMGKLGWLQDLTRGVMKLCGFEESNNSNQVIASIGPTSDSLTERGFMSLEDNQWDKAKALFDEALCIEPKCGKAYLGLAMAEGRCSTLENYAKGYISGRCKNGLYHNRARQFSSNELINWFRMLDEKKEQEIKTREEEQQRQIAEMQLEKKRKATQLKPVRARLSIAKGILCAGESITAGVKADGTVVVVGNMAYCNCSDWTDIMAVSTGSFDLVGITHGGAVMSTNPSNKCEGLTDVITISKGFGNRVGLKSDGTAITIDSDAQMQYDISAWRDVADISAGVSHVVALKTDGTVTGIGNNTYGQNNTSSWKDIVAVATGNAHTVGLKSDGTVVAVGSNMFGQCNVDNWGDIVAVSAANMQTVGLRADGTVVAVGYDEYGQCDVGRWKGIVAISSGERHTVGLKNDGTVVAVGDNRFGECNTKEWKLFSSIDTLKQERIEAIERRQKEHAEAEARIERIRAEAEAREKVQNEKRRLELSEERKRLHSELSNLRGLFTSKRRNQIEKHLNEIENELKTL